MRPPYYLFYSRNNAVAEPSVQASGEPVGGSALAACSIVMAGIVAVAFLSSW
jgi:hypothetical protein